MRRAVSCLSLFFFGAAGCERKAPGPDECIAFAVRAVGGGEVLLERPDLRSRVDDLTTRCLTTPFDRKMLECVEVTGQLRACVAQFERRRRAEATP